MRQSKDQRQSCSNIINHSTQPINAHSKQLNPQTDELVAKIQIQNESYSKLGKSQNFNKGKNLMCSNFEAPLSPNDSESGRLEEEKDITKRNFCYEVEFYVRQRMKDLLTIQQFILANQYQRASNFIERELNFLKKMKEVLRSEDTCCQPTLTKDISLKSNIVQDANYNKLITNIIDNIDQLGLTNNFSIPIVKKLGQEKNISIKKLSWYLQQVPFETRSSHLSKNLAIKFIEDLGCHTGVQVLKLISKSVEDKSSGKHRLHFQEIPKSQISKLIEQFSKSKIKVHHSL